MRPHTCQIKQRNATVPEINSRVLSVRLLFCDKFKQTREESSLIFFTPASVKAPPHISKDLKFLNSVSPQRKLTNQ